MYDVTIIGADQSGLATAAYYRETPSFEIK